MENLNWCYGSNNVTLRNKCFALYQSNPTATSQCTTSSICFEREKASPSDRGTPLSHPRRAVPSNPPDIRANEKYCGKYLEKYCKRIGKSTLRAELDVAMECSSAENFLHVPFRETACLVFFKVNKAILGEEKKFSKRYSGWNEEFVKKIFWMKNSWTILLVQDLPASQVLHLSSLPKLPSSDLVESLFLAPQVFE